MTLVDTLYTGRVRVGALLWLVSFQYFVVQIYVGLAWIKPYSITHNTISDLGNTVCGDYGGSFVCSPHHNVMNISFVLLGLGQLLGALLLRHLIGTTLATKVAVGCMVLAGLGTVLVGLFPENTVSALHIIGATAPFLIGNIGLVLFGLRLPMPALLKLYTITSGVIALIASILFVTHTYLGIGNGGMERLTAYPQTIWLIIFGVYLVKKGGPQQAI